MIYFSEMVKQSFFFFSADRVRSQVLLGIQPEHRWPVHLESWTRRELTETAEKSLRAKLEP